MNIALHLAKDRGTANHGWLQANFSFSFAQYYNPKRMHFGVLRVLNDDYISGGAGFGTHPHDNMEIITIPLSGALAHRDSMGNGGTIGVNDVQVMSAGTGIQHSEYNASETETANTLQIWIFPKNRQVAPRYDQRHFDPINHKNKFQLLLSPKPEDGVLWVHQDTWFTIGEFDSGITTICQTHISGNGLFIFLIEGQISINQHILNRRDAIAISDIEPKEIRIDVIQHAKILIIEVPMHIG